jgi:AraC-like DNA-binding protein
MVDIFKKRELGVCKREIVDTNTAFTYYDLRPHEEIRNHNLPFNYVLFVLRGVVEVSCNEFQQCTFGSDQMIFLLRSSSVHVRVCRKTKLYVMYFDRFLSSCDQQLFRAYLPDAEKIHYTFRPIAIPLEITVFLKQLHVYQKEKVDCMHYNSLKHCEFFILLRHFCPREDLVEFLLPLISHSLDFRFRVLEKYMQLDGGGVAELAGLTGMGRKNFDKRFRKEFGTSPAKWMQEEKAKRLRMFLAMPNVTISDAMDRFYFNSPSHFNRFCRQYFNQSPGAMIREAGHVKVKKVQETNK